MLDELLEPRTSSTDQRFFGVAEALVVDNIDPEKLGRVRVIFPWFDPGMESEWCRVSNLYAGNNYGSAFIPEVGDEVLVAFIHGDMRLPIILGGLYNGKDAPPTARDGTKDQKMIRTKGKHEFLLDDTPGDERIRLKTKNGHTADMSDVDKKVSVKTNGGHEVVLDDSAKKVTIKTTSGQQVVLEDAGGKVTIQTSGGQSITMDAGGIKLTATNITLSGTKISLGEGAAMSLILGETLLAAFNSHTHNCTAPGTPSGPPVPPLTPAVFSKISKTN
ncbi:MAG TPA: phage baseplate assembly protein V [Pyrinomonadaceae bacterium]|jgi:uncharacterized protein involved in type VI secretion and phage assembly